MKDTGKIVIRLELSGPELEQFKVVKDFYGLKSNTEVVRVLVSTYYAKVLPASFKGKSLLVPSSTVDAIEAKAREAGLSVEEYVSRLVHQGAAK